jgi:hypothetical protein
VIATRALQRAGRDEQPEVAGDAAEEGGDGEQHRSGHEDVAPAHAVGDLAAQQQEAAEGQGVGGDDPRQVAVAGDLERGGDVGQGDVDDGGVENDHQLRDRDHGERQALVHRAAVGVRDVYGRGVRDGHGGISSKRGWLNDGRGLRSERSTSVE